MPGEVLPFIRYHIAESLKRQSQQELLDADLNRQCLVLHEEPVDITPAIFRAGRPLQQQKSKVLYVYPSRADYNADNSVQYLDKTCQLLESIHSIREQAAFEIRGNREQFVCRFCASEHEIATIDSAVRNFFPHSFTEIGEPEPAPYKEGMFCMDFIPEGPCYRSMTSYKTFVISPLNLIPQILLNIDKESTGIYQVVFVPLPGETHDIIERAVDTAWQSALPIDRQIPPSLQVSEESRRLGFKSSEFKNFYGAVFRIILPDESLITSVKAFIASYTYGKRHFRILDSYSQDQIAEMLYNSRVSYHTSFLLNSPELCSCLHIPYQIFEDENFNGIFASAPTASRPQKSEGSISIGTWACGKSSLEVYLPKQMDYPHCHLLGQSRMGKSSLLASLLLQSLKNRQACFLLDPAGDLVDSLLRSIPREHIDDVVWVNFGLDETPCINIRENLSLSKTYAGKLADDMSTSMKDITSTGDKYYGYKLAYYFCALYYLFFTLPDLSLIDVRLLFSSSKKGKAMREKIKPRIKNPIVADFLDEISALTDENRASVSARLSHLLIDDKSLQFFSMEGKENKISIKDILESGKLGLINLSASILGRQRSSLLGSLLNSLILQNIFSRASLPFSQRKPCLLVKDEAYLIPSDMDMEISQTAKFGLGIIYSNQYLGQFFGQSRDVISTTASKILWRLRQEDADFYAKQFKIPSAEFTSLQRFQALAYAEDRLVKVNTPRPMANPDDCSEEIKRNCIEKYYLCHDKKPAEKKKRLMFDML
ncbi:MAG: hypothetical protein AB1611_15610 [bacterium]